MITLIVYQIRNNRTRTRLRTLLLNYGKSVQNSVFEMRLTTPQRELLIKSIKEFENELIPDDSIRVYNICRNCLSKVYIIGKVPLTTDPLFYMV
jgi:CRISPR-associated protein Cas2